MTVDEDLALQNNKFERMQYLFNNDLFQSFQVLLSRFLLAVETEEIGFNKTLGGEFAQDIVRKMLDESVAFLSNLEAGAFYASFHHFRALIEFYASAAYSFSKKGKKKQMLERYLSFRKIFFYQKLKKGEAFWNLKQSEIDKIKEEYQDLSPKTKDLFNCKNPVKSWRGSLSIEDLLDELPLFHKENFERACHFTHLSSLIKRSQLYKWGLPSYWEEILASSVKYVNDTCIVLIKNDCITDKGVKFMDKQFSRLIPSFKKLHYRG